MFNKLIGKIATTLAQKIRNIVVSLLIIVVEVLLVSKLYGFLLNLCLQFGPDDEVKPSFLYNFFILCIETPIWEEFAFRVFPIELVRALGRVYGKVFEEQFMPYIILAASIFFGFGHGGVNFIFLQGFAGLILSRLYIKNGYSYLSIVTVHLLWNLLYILK